MDPATVQKGMAKEEYIQDSYSKRIKLLRCCSDCALMIAEVTITHIKRLVSGSKELLVQGGRFCVRKRGYLNSHIAFLW